ERLTGAAFWGLQAAALPPRPRRVAREHDHHAAVRISLRLTDEHGVAVDRDRGTETVAVCGSRLRDLLRHAPRTAGVGAEHVHHTRPVGVIRLSDVDLAAADR